MVINFKKGKQIYVASISVILLLNALNKIKAVKMSCDDRMYVCNSIFLWDNTKKKFGLSNFKAEIVHDNTSTQRNTIQHTNNTCTLV